MNIYYEVENKRISFGKYPIRISIYYMQKEHMGVRIEVRRFTKTNTVEIELLTGDDINILKKSFGKITLEKPTSKEVTSIINKFTKKAVRMGYGKEEEDLE